MTITELDRPLLGIDGEVQKDGRFDFTLRRAIRGALGNQLPSDAAADAKSKEHCFDLMMKVGAANGEVDLEVEDIALIKKRVAEAYPPWAAGQAIKMVEGKQ